MSLSGSSLSLAWTLAPRKMKWARASHAINLDLNVGRFKCYIQVTLMSQLPENISSYVCPLQALIQVSSHDIIAKQYNPKFRAFKSCNTFRRRGCWLNSYCCLCLCTYFACINQWECAYGGLSSLALWISNFRPCSPACQSICPNLSRKYLL